MLKLVRLSTEEQVAEPCNKPVNRAENGSAPWPLSTTNWEPGVIRGRLQLTVSANAGNLPCTGSIQDHQLTARSTRKRLHWRSILRGPVQDIAGSVGRPIQVGSTPSWLEPGKVSGNLFCLSHRSGTVGTLVGNRKCKRSEG